MPDLHLLLLLLLGYAQHVVLPVTPLLKFMDVAIKKIAWVYIKGGRILLHFRL